MSRMVCLFVCLFLLEWLPYAAAGNSFSVQGAKLDSFWTRTLDQVVVSWNRGIAEFQMAYRILWDGSASEEKRVPKQAPASNTSGDPASGEAPESGEWFPAEQLKVSSHTDSGVTKGLSSSKENSNP